MWRSEQWTRTDRMMPLDAPMNISPFLSRSRPSNEVMDWVKQRLAEAKLHSVQTFDLHEARTGPGGCRCPHHGTEECDCQMVVLLVYGDSDQPATLVLHGNDRQAWLSFGAVPATPSNDVLTQTIQQALKIQEPGSSVQETKNANCHC
jgi:hypothetical protein